MDYTTDSTRSQIATGLPIIGNNRVSGLLYSYDELRDPSHRAGCYNSSCSQSHHEVWRTFPVVFQATYSWSSRKRRRILKNNERIAQAAKESPETEVIDIRDQGFTRPSVLIVLPFRSWALRWVDSFTKHTPKPEFQVENHARFLSEYGLPSDTVDKLETAPPGTYPPDHVDMFKGNIDDSFRLGVKYTRKSVKLFSDFYQSDLIIASPLGLRLSIEKEK